MKKTLSFAMAAAAYFYASPAQALPCDGRGSNWNGTVQIGAAFYNFELRAAKLRTRQPVEFLSATNLGRREAVARARVTVSLIGRSICCPPGCGHALRLPVQPQWNLCGARCDQRATLSRIGHRNMRRADRRLAGGDPIKSSIKREIEYETRNIKMGKRCIVGHSFCSAGQRCLTFTASF